MEKLERLLNEISIYIRRAWDARMPVAWEIPSRYIYDYEFLYIKEGTVSIVIEDELYTGAPGDLFFFPPGKVHSIKSIGSEGVRQPHIHFDFYFDENSELIEIPIEMPIRPRQTMREDITIQDVLLKIPYKMTFKDPYPIENLILALILEDANSNPFSIIKKSTYARTFVYGF